MSRNASSAGGPFRRGSGAARRSIQRPAYLAAWLAALTAVPVDLYRHHATTALVHLAVSHAAATAYVLSSTGRSAHMSKPNRARFKLSEVRQRHADKLGGETIDIETDDGSVFELPAPGFWADDAKEAFGANRDVAGVKALLGPREYLRFTQSGGRADDVALVLKEFAAEQGLSVGESTASLNS